MKRNEQSARLRLEGRRKALIQGTNPEQGGAELVSNITEPITNEVFLNHSIPVDQTNG